MEKHVKNPFFLIPLVTGQITLAIYALRCVLIDTEYRFGNRIFWIVVVLAFGYLGPLTYLTLGRMPKETRALKRTNAH